MSKFPGYVPEHQIRAMERAAEKTARAQQDSNNRRNKQRAYSLMAQALPLLRQYGQASSMPAEIPGIVFVTAKVVRAWVVESFIMPAGNNDYGNTGDSEQLWALTETGLFGMGSRVQRGIEAIRFFGRPRPIAPHLMPDVHRFSDDVHDALFKIFEQAGIKFNPNVDW